MFRVVSDIDAIAVMVAVIANVVVGMIWMKLVGLTPQKIKERGGSAKAMTVAVATAVITAVALSFLFALIDVRTVQEGIIVALVLGVGLVATREVTHGIFEGRSVKLMALSTGHDLVSYIVMGIVLALWR